MNFSAGGTLSTGTGLAAVTGDVTYSGTGMADINGNLNLSGGVRTFTGATGSAMTVSGSINASNSTLLVKAGPGTLIFSRPNTFSGPINISGGVLVVDSNAELGAAGNTITLNGGALQFDQGFDPSAGRTIDLASPAAFNTSGTTVQVAGAIGGVGGLTKTGSGTVILGGANSFSGGIVVNSGILSVGSDTNLGAPMSPLNLSGGTMLVTSSLTTARPVMLMAGTTINASSTFGSNTLTLGNITNIGGNINLAAGTLSLAQTVPATVPSPALLTIMSTATVLDGGPADALGSQVNVSNQSVTSFDVTAGGKTIGSITGSGNTNIPSASLTANVDSAERPDHQWKPVDGKSRTGSRSTTLDGGEQS